ncbi:MAG: hypothetical protein M1158_02465 [Candidatus Marsarchaeota archaeon]|nr:hypothetical protein [Candidatus Marsarchaeota archaeon]
MEKHIFKFGDRSWAMVLPKAWVEASGISADKSLSVYEDDSGNLVVAAGSKINKEAELTLDSKVSPEVAGRWAGLYYRSGVKKLTVRSKSDNADEQFKSIQETAKSFCPGFEVMSRSSKSIVLADFTEMKEVTPDKILVRLKSIITDELMQMGKGERAGIAYAEESVNRFFTLGVRYANIAEGKNAVKYFDVFQLLELVADEIYELSQRPVARASLGVFDELDKELELCMSAFEGNFGALELAIEERDKIFSAITKGFDRLEVYLITEMAKNMVKVAEFCLETRQKG